MTDSIITSTITAIVTTDMSEKPFGFVTVGEGDEAQRYFVPKDVLQACGFATTQFVEGAEVELDSTEAKPSPVCVRIHKIGEHEAGVDEAKLAEAVAKALAPKPQPEKKSSKKGKSNQRRRKGGDSGPQIRGSRRPQRAKVLVVKGDKVVARFRNFDWDAKQPFGHAVVTHVMMEDCDPENPLFRELEAHEIAPTLYVKGKWIPRDSGFEEAMEQGSPLCLRVFNVEGKNPSAEVISHVEYKDLDETDAPEAGESDDSTIVDIKEARAANG